VRAFTRSWISRRNRPTSEPAPFCCAHTRSASSFDVPMMGSDRPLVSPIEAISTIPNRSPSRGHDQPARRTLRRWEGPRRFPVSTLASMMVDGGDHRETSVADEWRLSWLQLVEDHDGDAQENSRATCRFRSTWTRTRVAYDKRVVCASSDKVKVQAVWSGLDPTFTNGIFLLLDRHAPQSRARLSGGPFGIVTAPCDL